jgi:diguanylate cyclase (GGDEF)-like protein/PAS domain S-box-containing protein
MQRSATGSDQSRHYAWIAGGLWAYAAFATGWLRGGWGGPEITKQFAAWSPILGQGALVLVIVAALRSPRLTGYRRFGWLLLLVGTASDLFASVGWAYLATAANEMYGTWADAIYMVYYPLAALACLAFFLAAGGSLKRRRLWLDAGTLALGVGGTLWLLLFSPQFATTARDLSAILTTSGYGLGDTLIMVAAAILFMQVLDWKAERPTLFIIAAVVTTFVTDLWWVAAEVRGQYQLGALVDVGYCVNGALLATGLTLEMRQPKAMVQEERNHEGNAYSFLPVLAVLMAIALLFGEEAGLRGTRSSVMVGFVLLGAALVIARQLAVRFELVQLQQQLVKRQSEARLTELVRCSSDLIAVVDAERTLAYVSPAAQQVLAVSAASLQDQPAERLLGAGNEDRVSAFLDDVLSHGGTTVQLEVEIVTAGDEHRIVQLIGSDRRASAAIGGISLTVRDVTENKRLEEQLRSLAFYDPLTLLANRSLFADRVHHAVGRIRDGLRPGVLFIDLDNFKTINDVLGHGAGDQLLRGCAQRIVQGTRASDTVARLGGDEFAVLIDDVQSPQAAQTVAEHVLKALLAPITIEGRELYISASIGICLGGANTTVEHLLRNADAAMYRAKALGKGKAVLFEPEMLKAARRRLQIEHELAAGIERNEFLVYYQPIVDLNSSHLVGVEALMRWQHPTRGIVMPAEFIPVAEETGHIVQMSQWILKQACHDAANLRRAVHMGDGLRVSVNISGRYLQHPTMLDDVREALEESGLHPGSLVLEVTESLLLQEAPELESRLAALKALGVRLALDDFGTGYSSLAYLHRFPLDVLKIDRSFIHQLGTGAPGESNNTDALAKAILSLAEALGLDTVAEGIEIESQREALLRLGCQTGQGFTFGKPMPLGDVLNTYVARRRELIAENMAGPVEFTATGRFRRIVTNTSGAA